jgi:hypothetical protein
MRLASITSSNAHSWKQITPKIASPIRLPLQRRWPVRPLYPRYLPTYRIVQLVSLGPKPDALDSNSNLRSLR